MMSNIKWGIYLAVLVLAGCGGGGGGANNTGPSVGQITFQANGTLWRIQAQQGAVPENLTAQLDAIAPFPGTHSGPITVSWDGHWYVFQSERFDEQADDGWLSLTIAPSDLSSAEAIVANGDLVHGDLPAAVTSGGTAVVYADGGGPHTRDLYVVRRQGNAWTAPQLLTAASPNVWNTTPVLSPDGQRVAFDAYDDPSGLVGTRICEVGLDGTGFHELVGPQDGPGGNPFQYCHSAAYAPDGSLVFEAIGGGAGNEHIWRLPAGGGTPQVINAAINNDVSPNVLPDGRVASLWLNAPGGTGNHQVKVMDADGQNVVVLTPAQTDVDDIGLGCGAWPPL